MLLLLIILKHEYLTTMVSPLSSLVYACCIQFYVPFCLQLFSCAKTHNRGSSWCLHRSNWTIPGCIDISVTKQSDKWSNGWVDGTQLVWGVWYYWWTTCKIFFRAMDQASQRSSGYSFYCRFSLQPFIFYLLKTCIFLAI